MNWRVAEEISNEIIDATKARAMDDPDFNPLNTFAGLLLATMALLKTAPTDPRPITLQYVEVAIGACLTSLEETYQRPWEPLKGEQSHLM
jgi:hypothetical protein